MGLLIAKRQKRTFGAISTVTEARLVYIVYSIGLI
jgi:hypothetical protein